MSKFPLPDGGGSFAVRSADGSRVALPRGGGLTEEQLAQTVIGYNGFFDAMEKMLAAQ